MSIHSEIQNNGDQSNKPRLEVLSLTRYCTTEDVIALVEGKTSESLSKLALKAILARIPENYEDTNIKSMKVDELADIQYYEVEAKKMEADVAELRRYMLDTPDLSEQATTTLMEVINAKEAAANAARKIVSEISINRVRDHVRDRLRIGLEEQIRPFEKIWNTTNPLDPYEFIKNKNDRNPADEKK